MGPALIMYPSASSFVAAKGKANCPQDSLHMYMYVSPLVLNLYRYRIQYGYYCLVPV